MATSGLKKRPSHSTSRLWFATKRLFKAIVCCMIQSILGLIFAIGGVSFRPEDFGPSHDRFIRKSIWSDCGPPITSREISIRFFLAVHWIWLSYLMLEVCHIQALDILCFGSANRHPGRMASLIWQGWERIWCSALLGQILVSTDCALLCVIW